MANDIHLRYTDENYVTKAGLKNALHMSLVDDFWKRILAYRDSSRVDVKLPTFAKKNFHYTASLGVNAKIDAFTKKLASFQAQMAAFEQVSPDSFALLERELLLPQLREASILEGWKADDLALKAMLKGIYNEASSSGKERSVYAYFKQLRKLHRAAPSSVEDFFGESYMALLGRDDIASFYREKDLTSVYTTALLGGGVDSYAPFGEIPNMMDSLFSFLSNDASPSLLRACSGIYYCYYVRPFETENELSATLLGKALFQALSPSYSYLLPLESALRLNSSLRDVLNQSAKDGDLTYFLLHVVSLLNTFVEETLSKVSQLQKEEVGKEFLGKEQVQAEVFVEPEVAPPSPETAEADPLASESVEPLRESKASAKAPLLTPEEEKSFQTHRGASAIETPRPSYSDKEVKETARYILETNPSISKKQALFYASHCTLGRFYTIQDFKKASRCAYETARTSMDNLSELGFYAKKQIKNKFVYTPIKQGEEK